MENLYEQKLKVLSSNTDSSAMVGVVQALEFMQDNMSEYFKNIECDGVTLLPKYNAFWVMLKTKLKFIEPIRWLDFINIKTKITKISSLRLNLHTQMYINEKLAIDGAQEMCLMDGQTRKIRPLESIDSFPKNIKIDDDFIDIGFEKFQYEISEKNYVKNKEIYSVNVDYFGHTNNVEYARIVLSALPLEFLKNIKITEFEIHYIKESRENMNLQIYKNFDNDCVYICIKNGDVLICESKIKYINI